MKGQECLVALFVFSHVFSFIIFVIAIGLEIFKKNEAALACKDAAWICAQIALIGLLRKVHTMDKDLKPLFEEKRLIELNAIRSDQIGGAKDVTCTVEQGQSSCGERQ